MILDFPEDVSTIQKNRVLGNSLNVHVVSVLIRLLTVKWTGSDLAYTWISRLWHTCESPIIWLLKWFKCSPHKQGQICQTWYSAKHLFIICHAFELIVSSFDSSCDRINKIVIINLTTFFCWFIYFFVTNFGGLKNCIFMVLAKSV